MYWIYLAEGSNAPLGFFEMQGMCSLAEDLLTSQEGLCSKEFIG
jgi:hypothetical protein